MTLAGTMNKTVLLLCFIASAMVMVDGFNGANP
jgi:hypothetical protein